MTGATAHVRFCHKQTFSELCAMSALPPKADMDQRSCNVYFVPKADIRTTVGYDLITCLGRCSSSRGIILKLPRRHLFHLAAGGAVSLAVSRIASALDYPTRPVRLILSFPAGGPNDVVGRLLGQWLSERLGQPFVIIADRLAELLPNRARR